MSERKFHTGDAFYIAAGRGLAATFFKSFADQFEAAYRVFDDTNTDSVQGVLLNTVPLEVMDEVKNAFDELAINFTSRLAIMAGEFDEDEPCDDKCCGGHCDSAHISAEIAAIPGVDELLPIPAEAAAE